MATGINLDGKQVAVNDRVSIIGIISAFSTTDETSQVTVQPKLTTATFIANALDVTTVEGTSCGPAVGNALTVGNQCTVRGVVTAISGSGVNALLTVTLSTSGMSVTGIPAGSCHSAQFV